MYAPDLLHIMTTVITEPSICIPRTLHNVTWRQVKDAFEQVIGKGTVERVDIVPSKNNESTPFCRIFVHFRYWPVTPDIMAIRERLVNGEVIKVVYDNPWFWKCSASRIPRPERNQPKMAAFIECNGEIAPSLRPPTTPAQEPCVDAAMQTPPPAERCQSPSPMRCAAVRGHQVNASVTVCDVRQPDFGARQDQVGEGVDEVSDS